MTTTTFLTLAFVWASGCGQEEGRTDEAGPAQDGQETLDNEAADAGADGKLADAGSCHPEGQIAFHVFRHNCLGEKDLTVQTIKMWSNGEQDMTVVAIDTGSKPPSQFQAIACMDPPFVIPPCQSCDLTVSWTPLRPGPDVVLGDVTIHVQWSSEEIAVMIELCALIANGLPCPKEDDKCAL